ncbi:DUF1992 domain-containing protein [Pelotomaculum sp. PtaB.Bin117]|uniref:DnaJ family domain-containing protein n=1 Tax=Pelotomaculum sp. PtaB.Bin117 TaxID=1811694 RepID=UPI0009D4D972|nr:DUF1992 domain-containing protein [Pelotomaculum sp. PtaB.Bin117]OPX87026.1 MAG: hypothetical protein A4E54_01855 [Pelotomaculum sp. PtaB.Bin117]
MFEKIAEARIKEALLKGVLKNLPGEGKPLKLEKINPFESPEERFLNILIKSSGALPIEILLLKEIESIEQRLKDCIIASEKENLKQKLKELKFKYDVQIEAYRFSLRKLK